MSDSESLLSDATPNAETIEQELRSVVSSLQRQGKLEDLTVNIVRMTAETRLSLGSDFFKSGAWKEKSKAIIKAAVVRSTIDNCSITKPSSLGRR